MLYALQRVLATHALSDISEFIDRSVLLNYIVLDYGAHKFYDDFQLKIIQQKHEAQLSHPNRTMVNMTSFIIPGVRNGSCRLVGERCDPDLMLILAATVHLTPCRLDRRRLRAVCSITQATQPQHRIRHDFSA